MQEIQQVPNSKFSISPLTTVSGTIVAKKTVKIPASNQFSYYSGYNSTTKTGVSPTIKWILADNENVIDLRSLVFVMDLTVTTHRLLQLAWDQDPNAIIARLKIGSPQGTEIESIEPYNLIGNMMDIYSMSAQSKERSMLGYSDHDKTYAKASSLNHILDSSFDLVGHSVVDANHTMRLHLKIRHSSFVENVRILPTFLFRNGFEIELSLENVYKMLCPQHATAPSLLYTYSIVNRDLDVETIDFAAARAVSLNAVEWILAPGPMYYNPATKAFASRASIHADNNALKSGGVMIPTTYSSLYGYSNGTLVSHNAQTMIFVSSRIYRVIMENVYKTPDPNLHFGIPVTFQSRGKQIWRGFASLPMPKTFYPHNTYAQNTINNTAADDAKTEALHYALPSTWGEHTFARLSNSAGNVPTLRSLSKGTATAKDAFETDTVGMPGFVGLFLYSYSADEQLPPCVFTDAAYATGVTLWDNFKLLYHADTSVSFDIQNSFYFNHNGVNPINNLTPVFKTGICHPELLLWLAPNFKIEYEVTHPELIVEMYKPDANVFMMYQNGFISSSGLPWKYKKAIFNRETLTPQKGTLSMNVKVSARSVSGFAIAFQDPACSTPTNDYTKILLPMLSSFMRKGMTEVKVIIGGQTYPHYKLHLKAKNTHKSNDAHIVEAERFFNVATANGFNVSSADISSTRYTRNYASAGNFDESFDAWYTAYTSAAAKLRTVNNTQDVNNLQAPTDPFPPLLTLPYLDASSYVLFISLCKDDQSTFMAGIDTTQTGTVSIQMTFDDPGYLEPLKRPIECCVVSYCDALYTHHRDGGIVRF